MLPSTPLVLSIGKRCLEEGYTIVWHAHKAPYIIDSNGIRHELVVRDNVPHVLDRLGQLEERRAHVSVAPSPEADMGSPQTTHGRRPTKR